MTERKHSDTELRLLSDGEQKTMTIGARRRQFQGELTRMVSDPGRVGAPGSPAEMLRHLAHVVLDAHPLGNDGRCGTCVSVYGSLAEPVEWPCDEVIRMGRIFGVWWSRA